MSPRAAAAAAAMLFVICSGAWPAHMSGLLSRASCAATARQWGLQHYLQHSSSSSSSRGSGMNNGQWSTDALAEMFEGVIGALLLDSDYSTVQQLLHPWVSESFAAARAGSAAKLAAAAAEVTSNCAATQQQQQQHVQGSSLVCAASSSSSSSYAQHDTAALLQEQLHQQCGYCFQDVNLLRSCSEHVRQLLSDGSSNPQADKWHFIGFSLLQFAAAQHAYVEQCQQVPSSSMWQQLPWQQQGHAVVAAAAAAAAASVDLSGCSTSSQASSLGSAWSSNDGSCDDDGHSSSSSSSSVNQVHLMSKQMVNLTNIRHRCVVSLSA
jgi:hypothetical protein